MLDDEDERKRGRMQLNSLAFHRERKVPKKSKHGQGRENASCVSRMSSLIVTHCQETFQAKSRQEHMASVNSGPKLD